ncbi:MAG TPA: ABC transporter substrate-binding protein, partial [Dehalococcoidia bacterium]|nr:ABC transporter substrate-binding protein [Dehalococcoidia bacterium]
TYLAIAALGYRLFYQGLLAYDPRTYDIKPQLAQRWEQPSQTEYIFHLQPDVKWHNKPPANGRALTVEDIVFSLERARTNDPRFFSRSILVSIDKVEAIDKSRLRITTKGPDATTLSKMSADLLMVLAPEVVERAGRFATADAVVGTGAFIMKSVEEGVGAEYVRNPDYWKPGLPYLDGIRTIHFKDEQAGWAAFLGGQVNIARVFGAEVKKYIQQQGPAFTPDWFYDNTYVFGQPNTRVKPFDDRRVYRALRLFIDHQDMIRTWAEVWFGRGRHGSLFPTALHQWDLTDEEYEKYHPWKPAKEEAVREAIALLNAAGYTRDNPLKFEVISPTTPFLVSFSEAYQSRWRQASQNIVQADLNPIDIAIANQRRGQRQFTYLIHGNVPGTTEPDSWLTEIYHSGASANFMNFSDPKFDEMIDKQRPIFDLNQRKAAIREIILYYIENGPGSIPANRFFLNAVKPNIRGYAPEFHIFGDQYEQIWLDT